MFKNVKRTIVKMFREFLVHHYSSLEYRAKILTLIVSANGEICECEKQKLKEIAYNVYGNDDERAEVLLDTIYEYQKKILTNNGLDFEYLIHLVEKETKSVKRFAEKINMEHLHMLHECVDDDSEEDILFQRNILEFMQTLKDEYGKK